MPKFVVKSEKCEDLDRSVFWAENVENAKDYVYLTQEQVTAIGGTGFEVEATDVWAVRDGYYTNAHPSEALRAQVAEDDGMGMAIGAAPAFEIETASVSSDFLPIPDHVVDVAGENPSIDMNDASGKEAARRQLHAKVDAMFDRADFGTASTIVLITNAPAANGTGDIAGWHGNMPTADAISIAAQREPEALLAALIGGTGE